jgi:hypothetical protein
VEDECPAHLMMKTDENVETVRTLLRTNCCLGIRMIAEGLTMDKEMVKQI